MIHTRLYFRGLWLAALVVLLTVAACRKEEGEPAATGSDTQEPAGSDYPYEEWDTIYIPTDTTLATLPKVCTMWQGHLVVAVDSLGLHEADITLLSLRDWPGMTSARHTGTPSMAADSAAGYREGEVSQNGLGQVGGWHIPSEEEARWLKSHYGEGSEELQRANALLCSAGADTIALTQGSQKARYLCDEARKSFSFCSGTNVTAAGATIKNYHLRVVASIHLTR